MNLELSRLGSTVRIAAEPEGLTIRANGDLSRHDNWPADALAATHGWQTAIEIEQLLELGFAEEGDRSILVPYANFPEILVDMPVDVISKSAAPSPFLLKIDRKSDIGRPDFSYRYEFLLAGKPIPIERVGYYLRRRGETSSFLLDVQMHSLVEAMDAFNALPATAKTPQESWLTFAKVKGCATEVGATLDSTLQSNEVIVPSTLGLVMREDEDGSLTFLPKCAELTSQEFAQVFERNPGAEKVYSIDRAGLGRVRVVLSDQQHEVLRRMKRVRGIRGARKETLIRDPVQVFDGVADHIDLPYGDRVIGIGEFAFNPTPRLDLGDASMAGLWEGKATPGVGEAQSESDFKGEELKSSKTESDSDVADAARADTNPEDASSLTHTPDFQSGGSTGADNARSKKYLLIETNEESVGSAFLSEAETAKTLFEAPSFKRPLALRPDTHLHPHQESGVRWLQTCARISGRRGVLLADDMGLGKTIQILTFLAWCIEEGVFPDLSRKEPPFRPILIIAPLILLDTRTWEMEMEKFFENTGVVFWPGVTLHGDQLARFRRADAEGPETDIGKPVLDLDRILRHKVVLTNYETVKNYQHSFAFLKDGKPLWSVIVSDEAQEFKIPSTKLSHAMKAIEAQLHIVCTGTPVENRLLDLWNLSDVFQPGLLGSAKAFVDQFEKPRDADTQEQSLVELKKKLLFQQDHAFLLRRTKSEVADLPKKQIIKIECAMSDDEINAHEGLLKELGTEGSRTRFLSVLHRFAQLYQHPAILSGDSEDLSAGALIDQSSKLQNLLKVLHTIRAKREKAIIFSRHRVMQGILAKILQQEFQIPVRIINGETKLRAGSLRTKGVKTRSAILDDFRRTQGFNLLILSPFVAGIGLTVVEANHVVHYGRWWNPAVEAQATDRAYRIGQTKDVFVYLPILTDTSGRVAPSFDERLDILMDKKQRLAEDFLRPLPPEDALGSELYTDLQAEATRRSSF